MSESLDLLEKTDEIDDGIALNNESGFALSDDFLSELAQLADYVLMQEQAPLTAIMSVTLVDDEEMARLNAEYRGKQEATDVLSFPCDDESNKSALSAEGLIDDDDPNAIYWAEFEAAAGATPILLGDVVIAPKVAVRQAAQSLGIEGQGLSSLDSLNLEALQLIAEDHLDDPASTAGDLKESALAEMRLLLVHGTLHLLGYDHEESDDQAEEMEQREKDILGDWAEFTLIDLNHDDCGGGCCG